MNIAVIDAEITGRTRHRFPNLCSMKISAYHKRRGDNVVLKTDFNCLDSFDHVYISKVFTKTVVPEDVLSMPNVTYGGTGFFYDKAPPLPEEIEHIMPDYHLYDEWVASRISEGGALQEFKFYLDYSIGYLTRKCFRQCYYCVNRNYKRVEPGSALAEFYDPERPKICFLDDNFFGYPKWRELIQPVLDTGRRFQFKQGLDERLLNTEKIQAIIDWKYDGEIIFAFDNIEDEDLIISKLELIRSTPGWNKAMKFYVFCGCDKNDVYDEEFWKRDIINLFHRIDILGRYGALPYVMRFQKVYDTECSSFYATVAAWANQPAMFKKKTFRQLSIMRGTTKTGTRGASWRAMEEIERKFPEIANEYYDRVMFVKR